MEAVRGAIARALADGVSSSDIFDELAVQSQFRNCPRVVGLKLGCVGRRTSITGIKVSTCVAHELVYVDQRWCKGREFYSPCFEVDWAARLELFLRKISPKPVIISRHGRDRDKVLLAHAFLDAGIFHSPIVAGCSSLAHNQAFPTNVDEIPSFLNVLQVTPSTLLDSAR